MIIYKITCNKTNKIYIGQTIHSKEWRFNKHLNDAKNGLNTHFANALRKYGKDAFIIEEIDRANTQEELTKKEYYWINMLNACDSNIGYNETSDEHKCGGNTYQYKTNKELKAIKEKISKANSGSNNGEAKAVKCKNIKTNKEYEFDTIIDCAQFFKVKNRDRIRERLNGSNLVYKNEWIIAYKDKDYPINYQILDRSTLKGTPVILTNINDNSQISFPSKCKAADFLHINKAAIINESIINNYKIQF